MAGSQAAREDPPIAPLPGIPVVPALLDMAEADPFHELDAWLEEAEANEGEAGPEVLQELEDPWAEPPME